MDLRSSAVAKMATYLKFDTDAIVCVQVTGTMMGSCVEIASK